MRTIIFNRLSVVYPLHDACSPTFRVAQYRESSDFDLSMTSLNTVHLDRERGRNTKGTKATKRKFLAPLVFFLVRLVFLLFLDGKNSVGPTPMRLSNS